MTLIQIRVMIISLLVSVSVAADQGARVALVIGNGAYQYAALQHPPQEAEAMAVALEACGFRVIKRINCSQREMEQAIRAFGQEIEHGDVGLFYYGGHGVQVQGSNYLIPVDTDIQEEDEVKFKAVNAEMVLAKMEAAGSGVNIVILDACRHNPFGSRFRSATRGLKKMDTPNGTLLAYSTGPGKVAVDGMYTPALIKHMKTPGLSVMQVFMNVRGVVMSMTGDSQVPWETTSLVDDFFFVPRSSDVVTPTPAPIMPAPPVVQLGQSRTFRLPGGTSMEMVWIALGSFMMGSPDSEEGRNEDEGPQHEVTISQGFWLGKYEITQAQWEAVMGRNPSEYKGMNRPVDFVGRNCIGS